MLFINNMIEKALLINLFAQHIGHSTAVMLLLFLFAQILYYYYFTGCSSGGGIMADRLVSVDTA